MRWILELGVSLELGCWGLELFGYFAVLCLLLPFFTFYFLISTLDAPKRQLSSRADDMSDEKKTELRLEIAHVLFIDIVGFSKLLIEDQTEALEELNEVVRKTDAFRDAEAVGQLIRLPTGDGVALVFTTSPETAVECALQIGQTLKAQPSPEVRMGIHSGPVHQVVDLDKRTNVAGAGINI